MTSTSPSIQRLAFQTQRPREDGCGGVVLHMLTGLDEADIARRIGWREGDVRRSTWPDLIRVLTELGWPVGSPIACSRWEEVTGLVIVHVRDNHFMIYDADNAVFYDPWEWEGPSSASARIPLSYLPVTPRQP